MSKSRTIFEDVTAGAKPAATPGGLGRDTGRARALTRGFVMVLFAMVTLMIAIGGMTRLTDSGLSITEWAPISGAIPPLSQAQWEAEFDLYRQTTEYQEQNRGMSMAEFQFIYWWEWGHRQWGRAIGLVWALGLGALVLTRNVAPGWTGRLLLLGGLGGLQGAVGWWMVASGLAPGMFDVASYRLATHLGLAFFILGLMAWYILKLGRAEVDLMQARRAGDRRLKGVSTGVLHLAGLQILLGALVAGIDAGRNYIDWPLMAGGFTPDMWAIEPWYRNLFENDGTVQFFHRITGYVLFVFGIAAWWLARKSALVRTRRAFDWMAVILFGQMVIGIVTVMNSAPVHLALLHQLGAVLLVVLILRARFLSIYPAAQSVRDRGRPA